MEERGEVKEYTFVSRAAQIRRSGILWRYPVSFSYEMYKYCAKIENIMIKMYKT